MFPLKYFALISIWITLTLAQAKNALPDPQSCANRIIHSNFRDSRNQSHAYFFSWKHSDTQDLEVDWQDARNICRRRCMDSVSLESAAENDYIKQKVAEDNVPFIWTSGKKCNFVGCDKPELQPVIENGWFWAGSGGRIGRTTNRSNGDWSDTGLLGRPQPDNMEGEHGTDEGCIVILNNFYGDGVKWHDVPCHYKYPFVCEDSEELLDYVRSRNPGIVL